MHSKNHKLPQVLGTINNGCKCIIPNCPALKSSTRFMSSTPAIISFPTDDQTYNLWMQDIHKYLPNFVIEKSDLIPENDENPKYGICSNHFHKSWHTTIKAHLHELQGIVENLKKEEKESLKPVQSLNNLRPCSETIRRWLSSNLIPEVLGNPSDGFKCILPNCDAKHPVHKAEKCIVSFPMNPEKYHEWIQIIRKYLPNFDPDHSDLLNRIPQKDRNGEYLYRQKFWDYSDKEYENQILKPEYGLCSSHFHKSWYKVIKSYADELAVNIKKKTNNNSVSTATKKVQMDKMAMQCFNAKQSLENLKPCEEAIRRWLRRPLCDHKIDQGSALDKDGNYGKLEFKHTGPASTSKRSFHVSNLSSPFSTLTTKNESNNSKASISYSLKNSNKSMSKSPFEQDSGFIDYGLEFSEENFTPKACSTPKSRPKKRPRKELAQEFS